jgi:hypothetical protein
MYESIYKKIINPVKVPNPIMEQMETDEQLRIHGIFTI